MGYDYIQDNCPNLAKRMEADARPFICVTCKVIKRTKAGLVQVAMVTDPKRTHSFPERNVDILGGTE